MSSPVTPITIAELAAITGGRRGAPPPTSANDIIVHREPPQQPPVSLIAQAAEQARNSPRSQQLEQMIKLMGPARN